MSVLGRCTQADRKFLAVPPERYAMTCRVWRSHRRGQLHMDRLVIFLDADLAASRVSDKTRAPDLVKVRMVADDDVHACKMRADVVPSNQYDPIFAGTQRNFHGCWLDWILSTTARLNTAKSMSMQSNTPTHRSSNSYTGHACGKRPLPFVLPSVPILR